MAGGFTAVTLLCLPLVIMREGGIPVERDRYARMRISGGSACLGECLGGVLWVSQNGFTRVGGLLWGISL